MPTTPTYGFPYPALSDAPNGPSQVQALAEAVEDQIEVTPPVGTVVMSARSSAPTGWLVCDGAAVSRTTYAALFAEIGTAYGTGNGTTTFNLPDLRDRFPVGAGAGATTARGDTGGSATHTHERGSFHARATLDVAGSNALFIQRETVNSWTASQVAATGGAASSTSKATGIPVSGTSASADSRPPFVGLGFLIKT